MARIVFDSSAIISISEKCFIKLLEKISSSMHAEFLITKAVFEETIENPIRSKRLELNALRIKKAVDSGWLKVAGLDSETKGLARNIQATANSVFSVKGNRLKLLHDGEAESLALLKKTNAKILAIDERTARMLVEDPIRLKEHLGNRYGERIIADERRLKQLESIVSGIDIVRSAELIAFAFQQGFFEEELLQSKQALEAALFGVKYSGCAISGKEIEDYLQQIKG